MTDDRALGARALALAHNGKTDKQIAQALNSERPAGARYVTPDEARDLYQAELRQQRAG